MGGDKKMNPKEQADYAHDIALELMKACDSMCEFYGILELVKLFTAMHKEEMEKALNETKHR